MSNEASAQVSTQIKDTKQVQQEGRITIRLTDVSPVRIKESDWPLVAKVSMPLYRISPHKAECSLRDAIKADLARAYRDSLYGTDIVFAEEDFIHVPFSLDIMIRRHADGRSLIYGLRLKSSGARLEISDELGGELVLDETKFIEALNRCAKQFIDSCGGCGTEAYQCLVEKCLSKLPPQYIDEESPLRSDTVVVVLNGGQPVKISPSIWPLIFEEKFTLSFEAERDVRVPFGYELITVRQHASGKTLVYGATHYDIHDYGRWVEQFEIFNLCGGELLPAGADVARAVKQIGMTLGLPADNIRGCINGLPAQDLD